jgi:uncharacterized protein YcbK (DUF882 family)
MATKLSKYFTLEELTYSDTAKKKNISNIPSEEHKQNLQRLANEILDPIREKFGKPICINSGYRGPKLNAAVKGSKTSQHCNGAAADIRCKGSKAELFKLIESMIKNGEIKVGQLIWEYGTKQEPQWIHVSLPYTKVNNILYIYS